MPRIAIVSDIHGNLAALEAVAADIRMRGIETVFNLGDSLSGPLLPQETADFLIASGWTSLAGNHERQLLERRPGRGEASDRHAATRLDARAFDWIRSLPVVLRRGDLLLCHGTPDSDVDWLLERIAHGTLVIDDEAAILSRLGDEQARVVACGHSHVPRLLDAAGGRLLLNPGSVGLQAYRGSQPLPYAVHGATPDARYAVLEPMGGAWQAQLLAVPYDHMRMARLAGRNGFPDWEAALASGRA